MGVNVSECHLKSMILLYCEAKEKAFADYEDRTLWARKMLVNISQAGYFSSDRTIGEYDRDIWKLR